MSQRRVCFFFKTPAGCRLGDTCNWLHEPGSASTPNSSTPRGSSNPNVNAPNGVCRFFWNNGNCRFADCRFSHVRQGDSASSTTSTTAPTPPHSSTAPHPPHPPSLTASLKAGSARFQLYNVFLLPNYRFVNPANINRFVNILASCSLANEWVRSSIVR